MIIRKTRTVSFELHLFRERATLTVERTMPFMVSKHTTSFLYTMAIFAPTILQCARCENPAIFISKMFKGKILGMSPAIIWVQEEKQSFTSHTSSEARVTIVFCKYVGAAILVNSSQRFRSLTKQGSLATGSMRTSTCEQLVTHTLDLVFH